MNPKKDCPLDQTIFLTVDPQKPSISSSVRLFPRDGDVPVLKNVVKMIYIFEANLDFFSMKRQRRVAFKRMCSAIDAFI